MSNELNLKRKGTGYYSNTAEGITIIVAKGIESSNQWQLIVTNDRADEAHYVMIDEWFPTKREAYEFCVNWLMHEC